MRYFLILFVFLLPLTLFAGQYDRPNEGKIAPREIFVYSNDVAGQPYVVIGEINVWAYSPGGALQKIKRAAIKSGADAIINYSALTTFAVSAKGIAVRWPNEGERGILKLDDKMAIPTIK